jgi:glycosyltransferase involved in cell wall biosynthesis
MSAMPSTVTVAIPTLNAGPDFARTLSAVRAQRVDAEVELLVCDSGSTDATIATARGYGARLLEIAPADFSHGATRNLLVARARGDHVAFLTQDAVPAHPGWLAGLLGGFSAAPNVGLVFGPYRAPVGTSASVAREIDAWFASFSDGGPRVDVLEPARRDMPSRGFLGHLGFFTDANGCVARSAWERVPFRPVAYAEDHRLAQDMLRAGYAKVFVPEAAVIHAHEYSRWNWLRRSFDESRAVWEVYGWAPDGRTVIRDVRGGVMGDVRAARHSQGNGPNRPGRAQVAGALAAAGHHGARGLGTFLGPRSARWPRFLVRRLSLERRA